MKRVIKLFSIVLVFFMCFIFNNYKSTFGIYREHLNTKVYLSVLDSNNSYTITLDATGGIELDPVVRSANEEVGILPSTNKEDYNFIGWYTEGGVKVEPDTIITGDVTYYAHWAKQVCKKAPANTLHTETCASGAVCQTRLGHKANSTITYGNLPTDDSPQIGDAYDCDVNNDDVFNSTNERFYYVRENEDGVENAVLVNYTSYDENGEMLSGTDDKYTYKYANAHTYLPDSSVWTNPALIDFDGKASRLITIDDLYGACGGGTPTSVTFNTCEFFLENTTFQSNSLGKDSIWIERYTNNTNYYRIRVNLTSVSQTDTGTSNAIRPVIEVPSNQVEGYKVKIAHHVKFDSQGGSNVPSVIRYSNQQLGTLTRPTKEGYRFAGWYTDLDYSEEVTSETRILKNETFYAKWEIMYDNLNYVFYIPGSCTFNGANNYANSGVITSSTNDCISTINPTNNAINYGSLNKKFIDSGISLFNSSNFEKDFELGITIDDYTNDSTVHNQMTLVNAKVDNSSKFYPGPAIRRNNGNTSGVIVLYQKFGSNDEYKALFNYRPGITIRVSRQNGVIYYAEDDNDWTPLQNIKDYPERFNLTTWFGAYSDESTMTGDGSTSSADRVFKGTLSNIYIKLESEDIVEQVVTFNAHGGNASFASKEVRRGYGVGELPTAHKSGYYFDGWYTEDNVKVTETTAITEDVTFHAHWKDILYITFDPMGGTLSTQQNTIEVVEGNSIGSANLPTATKPGYYFDGWYTESGTKVTGNEHIEGSTTYHARYKELYNVTFDGDGGTVDLTQNPIQVPDGYSIGELPTATKPGHYFDGWYTQGGTKVTGNEPITADITYYARYIESFNVTFNASPGTASFNSKTVGYNQPIGELPTAERFNYIFDGWYVDINDPTTKADAENTIITQDTDYVAKWIFADYAVAIGNTGYASIQAAINEVPQNGATPTTIRILKNIENQTAPENNGNALMLIENGRNIILDLQGHTVSTVGTGKTPPKTILINSGSVEVTNGTITTASQQGTIEVVEGTTFKVHDATISNTATTKGQAIYNNGGTVYIETGSIISSRTNSSTQANKRGAVHNLNNGTIYITGGTIISENYVAIHNALGSVTIGTQGGELSTTSPVIQGKTYGVLAYSTYNFYDGIIKGETGTTAIASSSANVPTITPDTNRSKIANHEAGTQYVDGTDGNYKTLYLEINN